MITQIKAELERWFEQVESTFQVNFSVLEEVQQQLADAEEGASDLKVLCTRAVDTAMAEVATRDLQLDRAATAKSLVDVLADVISELEKLHSLQATV